MMLTLDKYHEAAKADPSYARFSVKEAQATFRRAGFKRIPKERWAWGDQMPGTGGPAACFVRNGVAVIAHGLGFEVYALGNGAPLVASFPEAEMAIRFVRALKQDTELMAAKELSDQQFERVQLLAGQVFDEFKQELEDVLARLREWEGSDAQDGTGRDCLN